MAHVHELEEVRRRRIWPAVVMFLIVLLLIGIIVAMAMNIRGSISWPAGGVEFGFRPYLHFTSIEPVAVPPPTTVATNVAPPPTPEPAQAAEPPTLQPPPGVASSDDGGCPPLLPAPCAPPPVQ